MGLWGKRDDMVVHEEHPYNAEPPPLALLGQPVTATDTFYSRNHGPIPQIDSRSWRLRIKGLVERPRQYGLDDLKTAFEEIAVAATLQCAGNRRAGLLRVRDIPGEDPWTGCATSTATWAGVRLMDVLTAAGLNSGARHVCFDAPDVSGIAEPPQTYGASIPVTKALSSEVMLAWAMNGEPLTPVHGAPMRVIVPGWIGARSVKWLTGITITTEPSLNYFQETAYRILPPEADPDQAGPEDGLSLGPVALNCEILFPAEGDAVEAGFVVSGYAFAGDNRHVARVDVSVDDGRSWSQADLDAPDGDWTWQHWRFRSPTDAQDDLSARRSVRVLARAWDDTGALQPREAADLWNPKGYVNNSWPAVMVHQHVQE